MYSLDLTSLKKYRNDSIVGFVLLHLCRKTENQAFNKKQFNTTAFALDSKCSKPNKLIKIVQNYITFEMMTQPGAYVISKLSDVYRSTEQM